MPIAETVQRSLSSLTSSSKRDPLRFIGFAGRVLPFDSATASVHAEIAAGRQAMGRPTPEADRQIAVIARSRGVVVVTRNVRDFADANIDVIDPRTDRMTCH